MGLPESLDVLSDVLDEYRSRGRSVRRIDVTATETTGTTLHATLDVPVSLCGSDGGLRPELVREAATLTDGGVRVDLAVEDLVAVPLTDAPIVSASERSVSATDDGLLMTLDLTIDPDESGDRSPASGADPETDDPGTGVGDCAEPTGDAAGDDGTDASDGERADRLVAVRDESVPPYEDTEYLRLLYESCDSFAEMSREIAMDVSSETVRRYMIEAGVHDPETYDTSGASSDGGGADTTPRDPQSADDALMADVAEEQLLTDGIGLPADLDLKDVADAVVDSRTIYEVHTHLGIGLERTRELLRQLDLNDLVLRRVDGDPDQRVSYEEVAGRIRQCVPPEA